MINCPSGAEAGPGVINSRNKTERGVRQAIAGLAINPCSDGARDELVIFWRELGRKQQLTEPAGLPEAPLSSLAAGPLPAPSSHAVDTG